MEYIDFLDEKYRSFYEWTKTNTNNFDSSYILLNIKDFLNIAISPPGIVTVKDIFDNEEIKYDAEKSSIAVVFATGNLFMNTSITLIRLIRTLCENGYYISIYMIEEYKNYYIKEEVMHTEGISDYNIINNEDDDDQDDSFQRHDAAVENIINNHEKND